ncbi:MAG: hypothetical protein Q7S64_03190 [bacterium]|nr:hypothetical protein [bacterium]
MKKFLSGSLILILGTLLMSALNYVYNLFINRALTPADFATYTALLGAVAILNVPVGTVQTVAARYSADYQAEGSHPHLKALLSTLTRRLAPIGLLIFALFLLFPHAIGAFFNAADDPALKGAVVVIGSMFLYQLLVPINRGILQGRQQFAGLSFNMVADSFARILFGLVLLVPLTGLGINQAIAGVLGHTLKISHPGTVAAALGAIVAGTLVAYLLSFWPLRDLARAKFEAVKLDGAAIIKYAWPTMVMFIFMSLLMNVDIILVKKFSMMGTGLTPDNAGEYATLSTLAKLVFYVTGPVVTVMFPMIAERLKQGVKHYKLLLTTLVAVMLSSVVILGIFAAAPAAIVGLLTPDYVHVSQYLVPMTVIFLVYGLVNVMTNYFLALKDYSFLIPLGVMSVMEIVLITLFHGSLVQVIQMVIVTQTTLLMLQIFIYLIGKREQLSLLMKTSYGDTID